MASEEKRGGRNFFNRQVFLSGGSGSGIRCLFDPWIRDSGMGKKSRSGSGSLETMFGVKILKFFDANVDPDTGIFLTRDPGWKKIRIRDPG
jgi:hypothetical protein